MLGKGITAGNWSGRRAPIIQSPVDIVAARGYGQYPVVPLTRASEATYVDADGTIKTAGVNKPRYDWSTGRRALLIEGASTDLFTYSGDMTTGWSSPANVTQSADVGRAPNGGDMRMITTNIAYGGDAALQKAGSGVVVGQTYLVSAIVRRDQNRFAKFNGFGNGGAGIAFDLQTGAYKINSAWLAGGVSLLSADYALIWGIVVPATNAVAFLGMASNLDGLAVWSGGEQLSYWGAQIEAVPASVAMLPTSRIITLGSPVTRATDLVAPIDISASNLAAGYTFLIEVDGFAREGSFDRIIQLDDGNQANRQAIIWHAGNGTMNAEVWYASAFQANFPRSVDLSQPIRFALSVGPDFACTAVNGLSSATDLSVIYAPPTRLLVARDAVGGARPRRIGISRLQLFEGSMSAAEIAALTA